MDQDISKEEILAALLELNKDKVAGYDGIPVEFYLKFQEKLKKIIVDLVKEMSEKGLTQSEGKGVITLIEKPNKNDLILKNWRPLTLLNCDSKIY